MPGLEITTKRQSVQVAITEALLRHSESLPAPQQTEDFARSFARFGDARVVLLGEATHGSSEFYRARAAITRSRKPAP